MAEPRPRRLQIELFFKALKQNLKIKTFVGTSANALKVHVWTALIAMLILKYLQLARSQRAASSTRRSRIGQLPDRAIPNHQRVAEPPGD